jgi:hypothetical protein
MSSHGISPVGQDVQETCSCTCLAEVLQESREPYQKLYDATAVNRVDVTAVNRIDVTHISLYQ